MQHHGYIVKLRLLMSDEIIQEAVSRPTYSDPSAGFGLAHTLKDVTKTE
jgi:hypothetical protein